jgi:hypothetical protein
MMTQQNTLDIPAGFTFPPSARGRVSPAGILLSPMLEAPMTNDETYERAIKALALQVHERNEKLAHLKLVHAAQCQIIRDQRTLIELLQQVAADDRIN